MRPPAAERALRRLVARLAEVEPDDVDRVLEALEPDQQREVRRLLARHAAPDLEALAPASLDPEPEPPEGDHLVGLSPWLSERVASAAAGAPATRFRITPTALAALQAAARDLPPEPAFMLAAGQRPRGDSLFRRLMRKVQREPWA